MKLTNATIYDIIGAVNKFNNAKGKTAFILSAEPGDIEVSFTFLKLVHDEESDTTTSYVRKTESGLIHITKLAQFDSYEPSEMLTELDQRILALMATAEDIKKLGQATYDNMPIDMKLDSEYY